MAVSVDSSPQLEPPRSRYRWLLELRAKQSRFVWLPVLVSCALIAVFARDGVPTVVLALWWLACAAILAVRWYVLHRLLAADDSNEVLGRKLIIGMSAVHGAIHGSSVLFVPAMTDIERLMHTLLLVGICTGTVGDTAGNRNMFLAYAIPTLIPVAAGWAIVPVDPASQWQSIFVAVLMLAFGGMLLSLAQGSARSFEESYQVQLRYYDTSKALDAAKRKLEAAVKAAESASAAKTRFLAAASHDLRQPVHTLSLFVASLAMRLRDPPMADIVAHLQQTVSVLSQQLDALLDISKLDAGVVQPNHQDADISTLIDGLSAQFGDLAHEKGLTLEQHIEADCAARTDPVLLSRVLQNLITNAIKYTQNGGIRLSVRSDTDRSSVVIVVQDTGCGVAPEDRERIFEEFYQVSNPSRDRTRGLGLGLAIVRRLTDLLGVELEFDSQLGRGTTITLVVPVRSARLPERAQSLGHLEDLSDTRILVVDDEEDVRTATRTLLEALNCEVVVATGTADAVTALEEFRPQVLLTDLRLNGGDSGLTVISAVRAIVPDVAVLIVTGDTAPDRLQQAQQVEAGLLHKPVDDRQLHAALSQLLRRQPPVGLEL